MPVIISSGGGLVDVDGFTPDDESVLVIDPTSNAARVTGYAANGEALRPTPPPQYGGEYVMEFSQYASIGSAGYCAFAISGPFATMSARIIRVYGHVSFHGTGLTASTTARIGLWRAYQPPVGNVSTMKAPAAIQNKADGPTPESRIHSTVSFNDASQIIVRRDVDPMHVIAVVFNSTQIAAPATSGSRGFVCPFNVGFGMEEDPDLGDTAIDSPFIINANEVLLMRQVAVAPISGLGIQGYVEWSEA